MNSKWRTISLKSRCGHITDLSKPFSGCIALRIKRKCHKTLQGPVWLITSCLPLPVPQPWSMGSLLPAALFPALHQSHSNQHLYILQDPALIALPPGSPPRYAHLIGCFSGRILPQCEGFLLLLFSVKELFRTASSPSLVWSSLRDCECWIYHCCVQHLCTHDSFT